MNFKGDFCVYNVIQCYDVETVAVKACSFWDVLL